MKVIKAKLEVHHVAESLNLYLEGMALVVDSLSGH